MISQTNTLSENLYGNSAPQTLSNLISLIQVTGKIKARANRKRMLEEILIKKKMIERECLKKASVITLENFTKHLST